MKIFSACYGAYDDIPTIPANLGVETVMYTDSQATAITAQKRGWDTVRVINHGITTLIGSMHITAPMLAHKWWKVFAGFDECDISVWLDASMTITVDDFADKCLQAVDGVDVVLMRHPWRDCVFIEAEYSAGLPRYESLQWELRQQAHYYDSIGHPHHDGLYATGFYIRRNNNVVKKLMDDWWWECIIRSHQDQVSFPVVLRLNPDVAYNVVLPWHDGPESWTTLGYHLK